MAGGDFEFGGPHGPAFIILALPAVVYGLVYACNAGGLLSLYPALSIPGFPAGQEFLTAPGLLGFFGWMALVLLLHLLLPAQKAEGVVLPNGKRLKYRLNGAAAALALPLLQPRPHASRPC
jgi:delta14-sterol reductase